MDSICLCIKSSFSNMRSSIKCNVTPYYKSIFCYFAFVRWCNIPEWLLACEIINPASSLLSTLYLVRVGLILLQCSYCLLHLLCTHIAPDSPILILRPRSTEQDWTDFCSANNLIRLVPAKNHWTNIMCKYFCLLGAFLRAVLRLSSLVQWTIRALRLLLMGWIASMIEQWFADESQFLEPFM